MPGSGTSTGGFGGMGSSQSGSVSGSQGGSPGGMIIGGMRIGGGPKNGGTNGGRTGGAIGARTPGAPVLTGASSGVAGTRPTSTGGAGL
jgi:hypothetical protein